MLEVSDILGAIDIVEYIGQYIDLEQRGREYWGLSCFKEEQTPSFSVDPEKGYWYDFAAGGIGGNLIDFVMRHDRCDLRTAINKLKAYAHISESEDGEVVRHMDATRVAKKYRSHIRPAPKMTARPLPPDCMERWYEFDRDKLRLWVDEGISWETLRLYQVRYDPIDDRIVYPIKDYEGNIVSVCGRTCDPDYKAKKLRKYTYKQTVGTLDTIYGFSDHRPAIVNAREIILFEGAKSCMKAHQWGFDNTGALLTSHLSQTQLKFLIRFCSFSSVRVVFALDSDVDISADDNVRRLCQYARVEWIKNRDDLLLPKDSPTDQGQAVFENLYVRREKCGFTPFNRRTATAG